MTPAPTTATFGDVSARLDDNHVAEVELHRPPANYFDAGLLHGVVEAVAWAEALGARVVVLCSEGRHFCAGLDFGVTATPEPEALAALYASAFRLVDGPLPVIAAVQGSAIGGGLGLALAAELAGSAPQAVRSIRRTLRADLVGGFAATVDHERSEQVRLMATADFGEGIAASIARRPPEFTGE